MHQSYHCRLANACGQPRIQILLVIGSVGLDWGQQHPITFILRALKVLFGVVSFRVFVRCCMWLQLKMENHETSKDTNLDSWLYVVKLTNIHFGAIAGTSLRDDELPKYHRLSVVREDLLAMTLRVSVTRHGPCEGLHTGHAPTCCCCALHSTRILVFSCGFVFILQTSLHLVLKLCVGHCLPFSTRLIFHSCYLEAQRGNSAKVLLVHHTS